MKNILLNQFLFGTRQIELLHFMLEDVPSLLSIRVILLLFLVLGLDIGLSRLSPIFHALCDLVALGAGGVWLGSCIATCSIGLIGSLRSGISISVPGWGLWLLNLLLLLHLSLLRSAWFDRLLALHMDLLLSTTIVRLLHHLIN